MQNKSQITQLLIHASAGGREAFDQLFPLVYDHLRAIAGDQLAMEQAGHTLQKTALVHEVYIKLIDRTMVQWQDRAHFYYIATRAMRRILVDYARKKATGKRGGGRHRITLDEDQLNMDNHAEELIELNDLIDKMAEFDERKSQIVEMRFFTGMSIREIAEILDVSTRTVDRDWLKARSWLYKELKYV